MTTFVNFFFFFFFFIGVANAAPTTINTPMGTFVVEARLGFHKCHFVPAKRVFYHPQREKAEAQMRLWDKAEAMCNAFNKADTLASKLGEEVNLVYRERAALTELLGWKDELSLTAHEFGLTSRLEKIGKRFKRLQRLSNNFPIKGSGFPMGLLRLLILMVLGAFGWSCSPSPSPSPSKALIHKEGPDLVSLETERIQRELLRELALKVAVKASIRSFYRATSMGLKRLEEYPDRLESIAQAFWEVWGDAPAEVQRLALALCLKETGCGFSEGHSHKLSGGKVKTSHRMWEKEVYMSPVEACGLTQVDTRGSDAQGRLASCATLNASFENAFRYQRLWLETRWYNGLERDFKKVDLYNPNHWLKPVKRGAQRVETYLFYRYNGGGMGAYRYGNAVKHIYDVHTHYIF